MAHRFLEVERGHGMRKRAVNKRVHIAFDEHLPDYRTETVAGHAVGAYAEYDGALAERDERAVEIQFFYSFGQ